MQLVGKEAISTFNVRATSRQSSVGGVVLDRDRLDYEAGRRGLSGAELARLAGITQVTLSRARSGKRVSQRTWAALAGVFMRIPVIPGMDVPVTPLDKQEVL